MNTDATDYVIITDAEAGTTIHKIDNVEESPHDNVGPVGRHKIPKSVKKNLARIIKKSRNRNR